MLKQIFEQAQNILDKKLKEKPSGWNMLLNEISKIFLSTFNEEQKVVWTSIYAFPMEIIHALDLIPFDFEIANTFLYTAGIGASSISFAEEKGYSRDICPMHRMALGAYLQGFCPEPNVCITTSHFCNGKTKSNEIMAKGYNKEAILLDVPNEFSNDSIEYVEQQLKEITHKLCESTSKKFDIDRLRMAIRASNQSRDSKQRLNNFRKTNIFLNAYKSVTLGIFSNMFYGNPILEDIHKLLEEELNVKSQNIQRNNVNNQLLWLAWVPVYRTEIFDILKKSRIDFVMDEVSSIFWDEIDERSPFRSLAIKVLQHPFIGSVEKRLDNILNICDEYEIDCAIHFTSWGCRHANASVNIIKKTLEDKDIKLLDLDSDICDERNYSPEQTKTKLNAFIEMLN